MGGSGGMILFSLKKEKSSLFNGIWMNPEFLIHNLASSSGMGKAVKLPEHCGLS